MASTQQPFRRMPGLPAGTRLVAVAFCLLAALFLLICIPAGTAVARFMVAVLAMAAVIVLTLAIQAAHRERTAVTSSDTPAPLSPVLTAPEMRIPGHRQPRSSELTSAPRAVSVPRFGRGARAQRQPWRLPAQPSPVPGVAADEAELGALTVRAASLVGPGHRCEEPGVVRQDAYRLGHSVTGDFLVVAVADGLSSSRRSDLGATVAVSTAVASLVESLRTGCQPCELSAPELFGRVARRMREETAARRLSDGDACTVLITAVLPTRFRDDQPQVCWVGWLGDASLWRLDDDRWRAVAGNRKRDEGGIASDALDAVLPHDPDAALSRLLPFAPGDVLTLVSDGVGDGLTGLPPLNRFLAEQWAQPPSIADFINHVGFDAEQFTDDRSAVTVWAGTRAGWST